MKKLDTAKRTSESVLGLQVLHGSTARVPPRCTDQLVPAGRKFKTLSWSYEMIFKLPQVYS
jgi:hypothetical protein